MRISVAAGNAHAADPADREVPFQGADKQRGVSTSEQFRPSSAKRELGLCPQRIRVRVCTPIVQVNINPAVFVIHDLFGSHFAH